MTRTRPLAVVAVAGILLVAGCGGSSGEPAAAPTPTGRETPCKPDTLDTKHHGVLTVATSPRAFPPWYQDNDPTNLQGYESSVANAVANVLGFTPEEVKWIRVGWSDAIAGGEKKFDFDIDQTSITSERAKKVDFSSPYLDVTQTVITTARSKADGVTTVDGLKELSLGAAKASTSLDAIVDVIQPTEDPTVYSDNTTAVTALRNHQIDAIVVDLPTSYYMTRAQLDDGVIVGQLPANGPTEQLGLVLEKDSPITECVSQAVDTLDTQGALEDLQFKWLTQVEEAPTLG